MLPYKLFNLHFKKPAEIMRGIESVDQFGENWHLTIHERDILIYLEFI